MDAARLDLVNEGSVQSTTLKRQGGFRKLSASVQVVHAQEDCTMYVLTWNIKSELIKEL